MSIHASQNSKMAIISAGGKHSYSGLPLCRSAKVLILGAVPSRGVVELHSAEAGRINLDATEQQAVHRCTLPFAETLANSCAPLC